MVKIKCASYSSVVEPLVAKVFLFFFFLHFHCCCITAEMFRLVPLPPVSPPIPSFQDDVTNVQVWSCHLLKLNSVGESPSGSLPVRSFTSWPTFSRVSWKPLKKHTVSMTCRVVFHFRLLPRLPPSLGFSPLSGDFFYFLGLANLSSSFSGKL